MYDIARVLIFIYLPQGCAGGNPTYSYRYVKDNGGVDTEASYPYEEEEDPCAFRNSDVGATVNNFGRVTVGDEEAMRAAIRYYVG